MRKFVNILLWLVSVPAGLGLMASALGGHIDPTDWSLPAVAVLMLPVMFPVTLIVLLADLLWCRKAALWTGCCVAVSLPAILSAFPMHIGAMREPREDERSFTLMTWNVMDFLDQSGEYPGDINPSVSYILREDPDVVCLQEVEYFSPFEKSHLRSAQVDSLTRRYPYVLYDGRAMLILSKFPAEFLHTGYINDEYGKGDIEGCALNVEGERVALFSVHLRSYYLSASDKQLYGDLTRLKGESRLKEVRSDLVGKVRAAAVGRAGQADALVRIIRKYGGENVIVCGDFNDVPGCYSLHRLADAGFSEVYPSLGFGYMNTYNARRFLFTIDHVLWRGALEPVRVTRGDIRTSDHYPLITTFVLTGE